MKLISLFSGAGGLDFGFKQAGFETVWANEFDKTIWDTFKTNFTHTVLNTSCITSIHSSEIPSADGFIGGPPCQSWSEAGSGRGINDKRGQLFHDYIRLLKDKQPKFFFAENVAGILQPKHAKAFTNIINEFENSGYNVSYKLLNTNDFHVPQDRKRVIIIGYRKDIKKKFIFPQIQTYRPVLKDAIWDLPTAIPATYGYKPEKEKNLWLANHEYMVGGFSTIYMSRNRVRSWNEPSFTIQASGRHAPLHPQAPKMQFISQNKRIFVPGQEKKYRRLSVRECARIQTFPDDFIFKYDNIDNGYKMVGNAVPVNFAKHLAQKIIEDLKPQHERAKNKVRTLLRYSATR